MRRSSAPSFQSLQPAKRGKFVAPFKGNVTQSSNGNVRPSLASAHFNSGKTFDEKNTREKENNAENCSGNSIILVWKTDD